MDINLEGKQSVTLFAFSIYLIKKKINFDLELQKNISI